MEFEVYCQRCGGEKLYCVDGDGSDEDPWVWHCPKCKHSFTETIHEPIMDASYG